MSATDTDIAIRELRADDVPGIVDLLVRLDAHVAGVPPETLELNADGAAQLAQRVEGFLDTPGKHMSVAETAEGRLVGMGDIQIWYFADLWENPERRGRRSAFIDDLWVEPECRGQGVAHRIVAHLLAHAKKAGVDELILEYALHNPEAAAFWDRLGFRPTGVRAAGHLPEVMEKLPKPKIRKAAAKSRRRTAKKKKSP